MHDIASHPEIRRAINLHWLPASPQWLLEHIFKWKEILASVAPELTPTERETLWREKGSGFSEADIALLDELAEHLGPFESDLQRAIRLENESSSTNLNTYVSQTMNAMNLGAGIVNTDLIQNRLNNSGISVPLAERAINDRTWTYAHIVIDEAQELTPMQWRMISRRNPRRSMTIVGDLDQRRTGAPHGGWEKALGKLAADMRIEHLTISYRTPRSILDTAAETMKRLGVTVSGVKAVRDIAGSYQENTVDIKEFSREIITLTAQKSMH
ncbi:AAA family ATPase [Arcanobacterium hippocoleae]